jgi:hypothetical protein
LPILAQKFLCVSERSEGYLGIQTRGPAAPAAVVIVATASTGCGSGGDDDSAGSAQSATSSSGAGGGAAADNGASATETVSAGDVSTSPSYKMVHTFGQPTQNQGKTTSLSDSLQGGLNGANGSQP